MADNFETDAGTGGIVFASDDIGPGVHYPITKLAEGALNTANLVSQTNGLPIQNDDTSISIDWNGTAPPIGAGLEATALRVTVATDSTGLLPVSNAGLTELAAAINTNELDVNIASSNATVTVDLGANNDVTIDGSSIVQAEDAVHGSGNDGVMGLAVRNDTLATLVDADGDYAPLQVSAIGALFVEESPNVVDTNNSTTTPLGISATYTGTGTDVLGYTGLTIQLFADQDSAAAGMRFEFSEDNTNWDVSHRHDYSANSGRVFQFTTHAQFFRVVFVNGTTGQGALRIQTILHKRTTTTTIHRLDDSLAPDRSATVVKSSIIAQAAGTGDFVPVQATAAGNLKVAVEEISDGLDIGAGNAGTETQRVSISTDDVNLSGILADTASMDTNLGTLAGAVAGGQMQVDIVADGAGLATQATLADVETNTDFGAVVGGGAEATALRVTIANNSTGLVSVDDGGGDLSVDNAGTFVVQEDGAALTALQLIDDVVAIDDTATHATGTTKGVNIMAAATPTDGSVAANDIGQLAMSTDRRLHVDADITAQSFANLEVQSNGADLATQTTAAAIQTAVEILDDWDETNRAAVNTISGQAGVAGGTGADGATVQRVTLATDIALPAGTNGIGKLTANSGVDIGDVDVTSIIPLTGATNLGKAIQSAQGATDTGVAALAVRNDALADLAGADHDYTPLQVNALGAIYAAPSTGATGGMSFFYSNDLDETEEDVSASPVRLMWMHVGNTDATPIYIQVFNTNTVTVGTTTPDMSFFVPTQGDANGAGFTINFGPHGIGLSVALTVAATTTAEGGTGPGANEVTFNCGYLA